jgi:two-component system, cell cycle response regulator DivK
MVTKRARGAVVLVVDDYADTRRVMRWMLEQRGYAVLEAEDGGQAVEIASERRPDLILMDLSMPQVDGFEATRRLREQAQLAGTPVVAVTAYDMASFRDRVELVGFDHYITKPIDFNRLGVIIEKLLAN